MKRISALFLSLLMVVGLVACGSNSGANDQTIRVATGKDYKVLDPAVLQDSVTTNVAVQMYDGLYKLDKDGNAIPNLATGTEISKDGLTYTVTLKDGLKWSDGVDIKAGDFVYAWQRATLTGGLYSNLIFDNIKNSGTWTEKDGAKLFTPHKAMSEFKDFGAVAKDDKTIVITLNKQVPYFLALLTNIVFVPVREDYISKHTQDPSKSTWADNLDVPTSGPFTATQINSKDAIVLTKSENYYLKDEIKVNEITFKVMPDSSAETSAFQSGQIDFATAVNVATINADEALKKDVFVIDPFIIDYFVLFNAGEENTKPELKDPEIRKAISQSIDRSAVLSAMGYGEFAYELAGLVPAGIPGVDGDFRGEADAKGKYSGYNIEDAKKIMSEKGYSATNMLEVTYKFNDLPMHKDIAQAMQASMKDAYINLTLIQTEGEAFFDARDKGDFELARHAMSADYIDPMAYLDMFYGFAKPGNTVDDAKYEALITEANLMTDRTARLNKLHEAEKYLVEEMNYVAPLLGYSDPFLKNARLKGITSSPEGHYDLTRAYYAD